MGLVPTYNGNRYVVTFVDTYSHFIIAVPTKDNTAITAARILLNNIFPHYGLPLAIHSDNAPEFFGKIWEEFNELCGFHISHSSPYWPQGRVVCERTHRTLTNQLLTRLSADDTEN